MLNCSGVPKFHTLLTLTYNFVHYSNDNLKLIPSLLADINKVYPQIKIIAAIPTSFALAEMDFRDLQLYRYDSSSAATDVWRDIISKVQTKYVYIGRNVIHFTWFDRLERLVREINNLNAVVVAAAFRTLHSGHWSNGCDQTIVNDYALVYRHGYHRSMEECLKCDHVHGPFVTKTELFTKMPLHEHMTETSGFAALFYSIKLNSELVVACPDSMSFVTDSSRSDTSKADWSSLARLLQVEEIHPTNGPKMTFSCQEAGTSCQMSQSSGLATSNCCRESVMAITKSAIQNCVVSNLLCSLEGPALSGALKFGGLSPWETTITISLHRDNFTSFSKIVVPMLEKDGYNVVTDNSDKAFVISSEHASVKVHSVSSVERDSPGGMRHTSLLFGDLLSPTPSNPALSLKQRYGTGFLEHMQRQQSINFTHISTFSSCLTPGHHACLDKYITDGNIQFRKPIS
ncbi:hypothetical protein EB796_023355 [Bugula neritina]|uniref:Uncharacterized protein n=1 Tax=Bugula neritina TaxID=10212 RepID=A0A7J7IWQ4_BUGNE|nr:hypothetical protein EB796_023355 [Bugula neritina]